jgi:hypothetical protein
MASPLVEHGSGPKRSERQTTAARGCVEGTHRGEASATMPTLHGAAISRCGERRHVCGDCVSLLLMVPISRSTPCNAGGLHVKTSGGRRG